MTETPRKDAAGKKLLWKALAPGGPLGVSAAFRIGRTLGREFAASRIGDRLKRYDGAIERNGFATVLSLRLVYFPFTPMDFGMGLTRVRFRDYLAGTMKEIWVSGNWADLLSFKVIFSVALLVFSFFNPKIIRTVKGESP